MRPEVYLKSAPEALFRQRAGGRTEKSFRTVAAPSFRAGRSGEARAAEKALQDR